MSRPESIKVGPVFKIIGWLLLLEAAMLLLPLALSLVYADGEWDSFLLTWSATFVAGMLLTFFLRKTPSKITSREGFLLTSLTWVFFSLFGMIPFMLCSTPLDFSSAFFETMSGFTTTGATVIPDVEAVSPSVLFWRAMMQWIGGLGIILFILAVLPGLDQSGGLSMLNAEISGVGYSKLHPRIRKTASSLWTVYIIMTVAVILLLWCGPMNLFESVCQGFSTVSTGGFSTRNGSIGAFHSVYSGIVIMVFMFLAGVNISLLYSFFTGNGKALLHNTVFRAYVGTIFGFYLVFLVYSLVKGTGNGPEELILVPLFHIVSSMTTTGFMYGDAAPWGACGVQLTMILMVVGACAGSTSGASKVDRIVILMRHLKNEIDITLHPNHVKRVTLNGKILTTTRISRVVAFLSLEGILIVGVTIVLTFFDITLIDALFATISALCNGGLDYGIADSNFLQLAAPVKWLLAFCMLIGRLELFTVLVLFAKVFWK